MPHCSLIISELHTNGSPSTEATLPYAAYRDQQKSSTGCHSLSSRSDKPQQWPAVRLIASLPVQCNQQQSTNSKHLELYRRGGWILRVVIATCGSRSIRQLWQQLFATGRKPKAAQRLCTLCNPAAGLALLLRSALQHSLCWWTFVCNLSTSDMHATRWKDAHHGGACWWILHIWASRRRSPGAVYTALLVVRSLHSHHRRPRRILVLKFGVISAIYPLPYRLSFCTANVCFLSRPWIYV